MKHSPPYDDPVDPVPEKAPFIDIGELSALPTERKTAVARSNKDAYGPNGSIIEWE